jgi:hypothetical protein
MAITNYNELKTAVATWLNRDDLTAEIPTFIELCEEHLNTELDTREMIEQATITTSAVNAYVDLPTGYLKTVSFVDDQGDSLREVNFDQLYDLDSNDRPRYYAITDRIDFESASGSVLAYKMAYYKRLDLATDSTNNVLTNHSNLYLFGSLYFGGLRTKDNNLLDRYELLFMRYIDRLNNQSKKNKRKLTTDHPARRNSYNIRTDS